MPDARIMIVEDDAIIGRHIQTSLKRLGYGVVGPFSTGEEAVAQASDALPDLILMDISLAGALDGVNAAAVINARRKTPVVFLTAFADQNTLQRAKITDPFGYLLKPFDERILQITIEMALYKHHMERRLVESEELLRTLVENQGEGVAILTPEGRFVFANPALGAIFNVPHGDLVNRWISDFMAPNQAAMFFTRLENCRTGEKVLFETEIASARGEPRTISVTTTPWIDKEGLFSGSFAMISDITERKRIEASERQARLLAEALHATAAALSSSLEIEEVLDLVLANVGQIVFSDNAMILMLEGEQASAVRSFPPTMNDKFRSKETEFAWRQYEPFRQMTETGQPVLISEFNPSEYNLVGSMAWLRSYLGVPLRIKGRVVGFINLGSQIPNYFKDYHVGQLDAFALQAGLAIENARLYHEASQRANFLELLNEITRLAISAVDVDNTMTAVAEKMTQLFASDGVYMTVWDQARQLTRPAAAFGKFSESYSEIPYDPDDLTLTLSVLRSGHALAVDDIMNTPYIDPNIARTFPLHSMMGLPLIADGVHLGAVIVGFENFHHFTAEEIQKGEQVSSQVALAISKVRLYAQVQRQAVSDELTGLLNRRGIFEKGRLLLAEANESRNPIAMIWLDIDHFKQVNDTYGHHIGDQVVQGVAECCRASVREQDQIGRYGGEGGDELIILLPGNDLEAALQVAERLRTRIASQTYETDQGPIAVTVSLGVAVISENPEDLAGLLNRADQAMYAAKSAGRNCVVVAEEI